MPFPFLLLGLFLLGGTAVAALTLSAVLEFKGDNIVVLGERRAGKTTLLKFLSTGEIPEEYNPTSVKDKTEVRKTIKLRELEFNMKNAIDLAGGEEMYPEWRREFNESDIAIYIFRADKAFKNRTRYIRRMRKDMSQIGGWLDENRSENRENPIFLLFGNYCDKIKNFEHLNTEETEKFKEKLLKLDIVRDMTLFAGGRSATRVVFGSLASKELSEYSVWRLLQQAIDLQSNEQ